MPLNVRMLIDRDGHTYRVLRVEDDFRDYPGLWTTATQLKLHRLVRFLRGDLDTGEQFAPAEVGRMERLLTSIVQDGFTPDVNNELVVRGHANGYAWVDGSHRAAILYELKRLVPGLVVEPCTEEIE